VDALKLAAGRLSCQVAAGRISAPVLPNCRQEESARAVAGLRLYHQLARILAGGLESAICLRPARALSQAPDLRIALAIAKAHCRA
jgi:hypothetical protein